MYSLRSFRLCRSPLHKARLSLIPSSPRNVFQRGLAKEKSREKELEILLNKLQDVGNVNKDLQCILQDFRSHLLSHKNFVKDLPKRNPKDIFVNGELSLEHLKVFGFDYDYTLANYTGRVQEFIYEEALKWLVDHLKYPQELLHLKFDPQFAIRGLQYDIEHGGLMKIDFLGHIQSDSVYHGRQKLPLQRILQLYPSLFVRPYQNMRNLSDIYSLAEACLLSDVVECFSSKGIPFDPSYVFDDIMKASRYVHSGPIHMDIVANLPSLDNGNLTVEYLDKQPAIGAFLQRLRESGKKLFLLTNSSFSFVNKGMEYLLDPLPEGTKGWTELFDIIIASANKPSFFSKGTPFRVLDPKTEQIKWERVNQFKKGEIYLHGSLEQFKQITGWHGQNVLYFGDHIWNDLREPTRVEGWKTGVIIKELEREVQIQNSPEYRDGLAELLEVERVINESQFYSEKSARNIVRILKDYRHFLRGGEFFTLLTLELKTAFNKNFGSVFRTHRAATFFAFNLQRYADVYTSKIENFLEYPMHYVFCKSSMSTHWQILLDNSFHTRRKFHQDEPLLQASILKQISRQAVCLLRINK